jgi:hypothetical protein
MASPYALYTFDEDPAVDGTAIADTSGNGRNAFMHGTASNHSIAGKIAKAFSFDGSSDYVELSSGVHGNFDGQAYTITAWVKDVSALGILASKGGRAGFGGWFIDLDATNLQAVFRDSSGTDVLVYDVTGLSLNDGAWHLITAILFFDQSVQGNNAASFYVDGALKSGSGSPSGTPNVSASSVKWGVRADNSDNVGSPFFVGKMDDARIYDVGLSADEIAVLAMIRTTPFNPLPALAPILAQ